MYLKRTKISTSAFRFLIGSEKSKFRYFILISGGLFSHSNNLHYLQQEFQSSRRQKRFPNQKFKIDLDSDKQRTTLFNSINFIYSSNGGR